MRKPKVISANNDDDDDDDERSHSLKSKKLKMIFQSYDSPVNGTKTVLFDRVLRQIMAFQEAVEVEANADSRSNDVLDYCGDFDVMNKRDLLCRMCAYILRMLSVKVSNRDAKVYIFVLALNKFDMSPPLGIIN